MIDIQAVEQHSNKVILRQQNKSIQFKLQQNSSSVQSSSRASGLIDCCESKILWFDTIQAPQIRRYGGTDLDIYWLLVFIFGTLITNKKKLNTRMILPARMA